jgi:hypothetical protein
MPRRSRLLEPALTLAACLIWTTPAWAPGSLGLDDVLQAVRSEPKLVSEIEVELRKRDLKAADVICVAARHGNQWKHLGGGRAAPYECTIGDRELKVEAERTYLDSNGRKLGQLGQVPDTRLFERAKSFRETRFRWTWSP